MTKRRSSRRGTQYFLLLALILCNVSVGRAQVSLQFTVLNIPLSITNGNTFDILGINVSGQVVGNWRSYADSRKSHGFLYSGGIFATIDDPGASSSTFGTTVSAINDSGQIVGSFYDAAGNQHGFLLSGGIFTTFDDPEGVQGTAMSVINNSGQMAGYFTSADGNQHGFLLSGGVFTTADAPGAFYDTYFYGINNSGQMAGNFLDAAANGHGFLLSGGVFTTLDVPGGRPGSTAVYGINASGQVVGTFSDATYKSHGFLYSGGSSGIFTTIDPSGSLFTVVQGINDSGEIVGNFVDAAHNGHSFLLSGGIFTTVDAPGASSLGTYVKAINDSGQMVGIFFDSAGNVRAFMASTLITFLDPVPSLLDGPAVTTDSGLLARPFIAHQVSGVGADGVAQIVVKIAAPVAGEQYTLTLLNDSNAQSDSPDEDGALGVLGTSTFVQSQIVVTAVDTPNGPMAFAIYRAPVDFARPLTIDANDRVAKQRLVSIQVLDNVTATSTTAPVKIVRPPVALIHGLWSDPSTWNEFLVTLNANNLFGIYRVNYQSSNFVQVPINVRSSLTQLTKFLEIFKNTREVAAVQFDLVGHSMGGLISRYMVLDPRFNMDGNYQKGWIHKLITIDTPHAGSLFPARLDNSSASCHEVFFQAGMAIDGATHDLEPGSALLNTLYSLPLPPTHAIAGAMTPDQDSALSQVLDTVLKVFGATATAPPKLCGTVFPNAQFSFSGLYGEPNDIAVAQSSQVYGFSPGVTADVVQGVIHSQVPPLPWLVQFVAPPPGALDAASGNPSVVLNLLNIPPSNGAFKQGIQ